MSIVERAAQRIRQSQRDSTPIRAAQAATPLTPPPAAAEDVTLTRAPSARDMAGYTASFDSNRMRRAGLSPPEGMAEQIAREFQRIKRPVLAAVAGDARTQQSVRRNRLMVASAKAGEGKSFTALNLAVSLARERDHSVLLIDGDVIKPAISRALGVHDMPGLMDALAGEGVNAADLVLPTDMPGLSVLPAGRRCGEMTELLSSRRMAWIVDELAADPARIVLFDSPPLLATSESQAIALNVGQVLMVIKAGSTERQAINAALSLVEASDAVVSLILNQSRRAHGDAYAGYYGMEYGGGDERRSI